MNKDLSKKVVLIEQKRTSRWLANKLGRVKELFPNGALIKYAYTGGNVCYRQSSKCASTRLAN